MFKKSINSVFLFIKRLLPGLKIELLETKEMLVNLFQGEFKKASVQAIDLLKMTVVFIIFMIPFIGGVLSTIILQRVTLIRPSAFQIGK